MIRAYSKNQVIEMDFPREEYLFPENKGTFIGKIVMKMWTNKQGLICYFDTEDSKKYKLCVWYKYDESKSYRPKLSNIDISYLEIGTKCIVTYENKNDKSIWLNVELL